MMSPICAVDNFRMSTPLGEADAVAGDEMEGVSSHERETKMFYGGDGVGPRGEGEKGEE